MVSLPIVDLTATDIDMAAVGRLADALDMPEDAHLNPNWVIQTAAARLDYNWHTEDDIVPGGVAVDLPYGSLILRCDARGVPLDMSLVRLGEPGYAVRIGGDDTWYKIVYRPSEVPPEPGEAIGGERARRLPPGSIIVPAAPPDPDNDGAEFPDMDALVAQRQSDGTWHPATPAGSRYIVLHLGSR